MAKAMGEKTVNMIPKVDSICRACGAEGGVMSPIFDAVPGTLPAMISFCTGLEIKRNDSKPSHICQLCLENLNVAYDFKTTCLRSNQQFIKTLYGVDFDIQIRIERCPDQIKIEDDSLNLEDKVCDEPEVEIPNVDVDDQFNDQLELVDGINVKVESVNADVDDVVVVDDIVNADEDDDDDEPLSKISKRKNERYCCSTCGAQFGGRILLRSHLLKAHNIHMSMNVENSEEKILEFDNENEHQKENKQSKNRETEERKTKIVKNKKSKANAKRNKVSVKRKSKMSDCQEEDILKQMSDKSKEEAFEKWLKSASRQSIRMCEVCDIKFASVDEVKKHRLEVHGGDTGTRKCKLCGKVVKRQSFREHYMRHFRGHKPCAVEGCDFETYSSFLLLKHETYVHNMHKKQEKFQCSKCPKQFTYLGGMRDHEKRIHEGRKKDKVCSEPGCGMAFHRKTHLTRHLQRHRDDAPFSCEQCDRKFRYRGNMRAHARQAHDTDLPKLQGGRQRNVIVPEKTLYDVIHRPIGKKFKCTFCPSEFRRRVALKEHVLEAHAQDAPGPKPKVRKVQGRNYHTCSLCAATLTRRTHWRYHMASLHGITVPGYSEQLRLDREAAAKAAAEEKMEE